MLTVYPDYGYESRYSEIHSEEHIQRVTKRDDYMIILYIDTVLVTQLAVSLAYIV